MVAQDLKTPDILSIEWQKVFNMLQIKSTPTI